MTRRRVLTLLLCVLLSTPTGCSLFSSGGPEGTVRAFAEALQRKDANAAAADTSDPAAAGPVITSMFDGMGKNASVAVDVSETTEPDDSSGQRATAKLAYTWTLGPGRTLRYDATATAEKSGDDWHIQWSPTALHPKLRPGVTFQYSDDKNFLTPVVDRDGQPLLTWQTIGVVNLARDHRDSAPVLAPLLQQFDPSITADSINDQFSGTQDDVVTVIKLREADLAVVGDQVAQIPGVAVAEQGALLTANRDLSSPAMDGLKDIWQKTVDAAAGWSVTLVDAGGRPTDELTSTPPSDVKPIRTTLDTRLQLLAQQAVATEARPAVLVAISPSTGGILAAAQNPAANAQGPIAFSGIYPPGSTFKTITTAAALQAGLATPDTPEECPGRVTVENRTIPNDDEFDLGTVPLTTAFARSCNTTDGRAGRQAARRRAPQRGTDVRDRRRLRRSRPHHHHRPRAQRRHAGAEGRKRHRPGHRDGQPVRTGRRRSEPRSRVDHHSDARRRREDHREHPIRTDSVGHHRQPPGDDAANRFRRHGHRVA